jgi:hypothetical protein
MRQREGIEPRNQPKLWMPTWFATGKAILNEPNAKVQEGSPGSKTVARHQDKVGNSGDPKQSPADGVRWHNQKTGRKPDAAGEVGCSHSSEEVE